LMAAEYVACRWLMRFDPKIANKRVMDARRLYESVDHGFFGEHLDAIEALISLI